MLGAYLPNLVSTSLSSHYQFISDCYQKMTPDPLDILSEVRRGKNLVPRDTLRGLQSYVSFTCKISILKSTRSRKADIIQVD